MTSRATSTTKRNVHQFDSDVRESGSYVYTSERLSCRLANARISSAIASAFPFSGCRVLDLGCGDGAYSVEFAALGASSVLGIDPAGAAIDAARARAVRLGIADRVGFATGNIYDLGGLFSREQFDCVVLRGVLHHLPDPQRAIAGLAASRSTIIVLEPNGLNPVLKLLERFSRYHKTHEERSFSPRRICRWLKASGFRPTSVSVFNLVPFFCPDWLARQLSLASPVIEWIPLLRDIMCGQVIVVAET